jgi:hypothetical protein
MYKPQTQNQARRSLRTTQSQLLGDPSGKNEEAGLLQAFKNLLRPFKSEPIKAESRPRRASAINRDRLMRRMQIVASETDYIEFENDCAKMPAHRESFDRFQDMQTPVPRESFDRFQDVQAPLRHESFDRFQDAQTSLLSESFDRSQEVQTPPRRESFDEGTINDGTLRPYMTEDSFAQQDHSSYPGLIDRICAEVRKMEALEKAANQAPSVRPNYRSDELFAPPPMSSAAGIPCVPLYGIKQKSLPPISVEIVKSTRRSDFGVGLPPVSH